MKPRMVRKKGGRTGLFLPFYLASPFLTDLYNNELRRFGRLAFFYVAQMLNICFY